MSSSTPGTYDFSVDGAHGAGMAAKRSSIVVATPTSMSNGEVVVDGAGVGAADVGAADVGSAEVGAAVMAKQSDTALLQE